MQFSNNKFLDSVNEFLKTNNIKLEDILDKFFNIKNDSSNKEEVINDNKKESSADVINNDEDEVLVNKLNNIKNIMNQILNIISKSNWLIIIL